MDRRYYVLLLLVWFTVLTGLAVTCRAVRADFVLDMTMCRVPAMRTCEEMSLLVRRHILVCRLGAPKIIKRVEEMNLSQSRTAKWKLKRYECRSVPNGTRI